MFTTRGVFSYPKDKAYTGYNLATGHSINDEDNKLTGYFLFLCDSLLFL
jgi:hypothetical protein